MCTGRQCLIICTMNRFAVVLAVLVAAIASANGQGNYIATLQ